MQSRANLKNGLAVFPTDEGRAASTSVAGSPKAIVRSGPLAARAIRETTTMIQAGWHFDHG